MKKNAYTPRGCLPLDTRPWGSLQIKQPIYSIVIIFNYFLDSRLSENEFLPDLTVTVKGVFWGSL
jgi:hypothetical protein